jgi:chaperone required for assembly of F1-ATPase
LSADPARRFYRQATTAGDGAGVMLDERRLKTPGGSLFAAPTRALSQAIASEWNAQGEFIAPASMPLTQFGFAAIDVTPSRRGELARTVAKYTQTDLVSHRADAPPALVARQAAAWDPLVDWAHQRFNFRMPVVTGVIAAPVSPQNLTAMERETGALDDFRATALVQAVTLAGSAVVGFALLEGRLDAEAAFAAAALDELWSLENWGEDGQARARLERRRGEFAALARFVAALDG